MAPFFTVFVNPTRTEESAHILEILGKSYTCLVDSFLGLPFTDETILQKYGKINGFNFIKDDVWMVGRDGVRFCLSFDVDQEIDHHEEFITKWINATMVGDTSLDEEMFQIVERPTKVDEIAHEPETPVKQCDHYTFRFEGMGDMCLVEIGKPFTDRPYTCCIKSFAEQGFLPVFTNLFVDQSWGVCAADIQFLTSLWKHLDMEGELDLENRLEKATKDCYFQKDGDAVVMPNAEPVVYRKCIEELKTMFVQCDKLAKAGLNGSVKRQKDVKNVPNKK